MDPAPLYLVRCACSFQFFLEDDRNQASCPHCKAGLDLVLEDSQGPARAAGEPLEAVACPLCSAALWVPASRAEARCDQCGATLELLEAGGAGPTPAAAPGAPRFEMPVAPPAHRSPPAEAVPFEPAWPRWVAAGFSTAEHALAPPEDPAEPRWVRSAMATLDHLADAPVADAPDDHHLLEFAEDLMEAVPPSHRVPAGLVEFQIVRTGEAGPGARRHGLLATLRRLTGHDRHGR